jgi:signal transduction histidine kinase
MSNALAVTRAQGGRVELSVREVAPDHLAFTVRDNGPGMTADEIEIARLPFRQLDMSHRRRIGGMGLGLTLAERMAGRLGGRLEIDSKPPGGTAAAIVVPRRRAVVDPRWPED